MEIYQYLDALSNWLEELYKQFDVKLVFYSKELAIEPYSQTSPLIDLELGLGFDIISPWTKLVVQIDPNLQKMILILMTNTVFLTEPIPPYIDLSNCLIYSSPARNFSVNTPIFIELYDKNLFDGQCTPYAKIMVRLVQAPFFQFDLFI